MSAGTRVHTEDAPSLLRIPKSECPDFLDTSAEAQVAQDHGPVWKTQSILLNEICTVILWQDYHGKGNWRKFYCNTVGFLSVYVDDVQLAGKKQNIDPMWKVLMKEVVLGKPTSFLDHVYFGCTRRVCQTSKDLVDNYRGMFESRISAGSF